MTARTKNTALREAPKRKKLLKLISENLGREKPRTMYEMMLQAGYTEGTARQQSAILASVKEEPTIKTLISRLEAHREKIIERLETQISKARYRDLIDGLDKITKNLQLLGGKPTQNIAIKSETRHKLDRLID